MFAIAWGHLWALSFMKALLYVVGGGVILIFPLSCGTHDTQINVTLKNQKHNE